MQVKDGRLVNNIRIETFKTIVYFFSFCSATIISPRAILTAAHCFEPSAAPIDAFAVVGINGK